MDMKPQATVLRGGSEPHQLGRDWRCIKLKVTDSLTLTIGVNDEALIRIRSPYTRPIEARLQKCTDPDPCEIVEVFND